MKKVLYLLCIAFAMQSCQSELNYKDVRKEVIVLHDKLMADDEKVMNVKMALDTLALTGLPKLKAQNARLDTTATRSEIKMLTERLTDASDQMSKWMENFKTDVEGKPNAEAVSYFEQEKVKVKKLDSLYQVVLKESDTFLKKFNIKTDPSSNHEHHMHNM